MNNIAKVIWENKEKVLLVAAFAVFMLITFLIRIT